MIPPLLCVVNRKYFPSLARWTRLGSCTKKELPVSVSGLGNAARLPMQRARTLRNTVRAAGDMAYNDSSLPSRKRLYIRPRVN